MMYKVKILLLILFFTLTSLTFSSEQKVIQVRIKEIEALVNNNISIWKVKTHDVSGGEKIELDDSQWKSIRLSYSFRDKVTWLRQEFHIPVVFSGVKIERSKITLACSFRGLGKFMGKFYQDGTLKESFDLEFGNHVGQAKRVFILKAKAQPGKKLYLAFRFENLGKLPLVKRATVEPGTFLQIQEARFWPEAAKESYQILSRFLLDLKIGATLLDLMPENKRLLHKMRPVSKDYQKLRNSKEFQALKLLFKKALLNFNVSPLSNGDFAEIQSNLKKFYREVEPVSRFSKSYDIYIAGNSHIDLAWLWRWQETVEVAKETFSTIMDNMEEYPEIVYVQSQAQAYEWMEEYYPEVFERIKKKVKEGRWEIVGGMWAEPDCNLTDGESFIRQILYGKRYFKEKFRVDIKLGWNPDSFGYNWNMPQFFKKSGIDAFITQKISWNDTNTFPYFLFWWRGPDGSKILTYFPPTGYVGRLRGERMVNGLKDYQKNTGLKKVLILYGLGNHGGGPNRAMLNQAKDLGKLKIFPKIKHSSASHYLGQIKKKRLDSLPVWKDELYLEYHRGTYTTQAETKKLNRSSEVLLSNAEKISSLAFLMDGKYRQHDLKRAWKKVLINQFHDILPGSSINPVYKDAKEFYSEAQNLAQEALIESLNHIAQTINTAEGEEGIPLLVFNTLSWERDGVVKTPLPSELNGEIRVFDDRGLEIPSQVLHTGKEKNICFIAKKVPPVGYRSYKIKQGKQSVYKNSLKIEKTALENHFFRVTLNPESGNIISIFDKLHKREVLSPAAQGNQLQLFEDMPDRWDAWNIGYTGRKWHADQAQSVKIIHRGPVMASIRVEKIYLGLSKARREPTSDFPSSFFIQEIILYEDIPRIDIDMKADWWEDQVLLKVAFPVDIKSDKATYEIPFAFVQRPTGRKTSWEKARFEVPAIRWADLSDDEYGVSLLNESKYGHDIKENVLRLTLLRSPLWPDPLADRGKHQFSYALYPHKGSWKEADTVQKGYEFNYPLLSFFVDSHSGRLPYSSSFFKASPSNIICATIKKAEDRNSLILRLYEAEGTETKATLEVFRIPKESYELDLMENRLRSLSIKKKAFSLKFGKSEIKSIELVY